MLRMRGPYVWAAGMIWVTGLILLGACAGGRGQSVAVMTPPAVEQSPSPSFTITADVVATRGAAYRATTVAYQTQRAQAATQAVLSTQQARATVLALTPTRTPPPTIDPQEYVARWSVYRDRQHGFSFAYPAVYDAPAYAGCSPYMMESPDGFNLYVGGRISLGTEPTRGLELETYVDQRIRELAEQPGWELTDKKLTRISGGWQAITVEYRFGMLGRFGTATVTQRGEYFYIFNMTAGGTCDVPGVIDEWSAYYYLLESFRFE